ncbi:MAG: hemolysin [Rhodothermaceae bacterium]|nr:MAG: hemolysin [Rhodothermaceae bacterium]
MWRAGNLQVDREELFNSLTHAVGAVLSLFGLVWLAGQAFGQGDGRSVVSSLIYGGALVFLYTASTLYHGVRRPRLKNLFRLLDHIGIYVLIAGSYTPFTLVTLRDDRGWVLFCLIWGLALAGILYKLFSRRRYRWFSVVFYLLMGWLAVFYLGPITAALPLSGVVLVVAGGLAYTLGVVFYAWHRLPYHHTIWHLFVLTGSACHFFAVVLYVIP